MKTIHLSSIDDRITEWKELLASGIGPATFDLLTDRVIDAVGELGRITLRSTNEQTIAIELDDDSKELAIPRARSIFRAFLARFAVRFAGLTNRDVSPYGDTVEVEHPTGAPRSRIEFGNTTQSQFIRVGRIALDGNRADGRSQ